MRKNNRKKLTDNASERGSVLMEFVIVLPLYIAVMGGILSIGLTSLDMINLRSADHWGVWMAGNRFSTRVPAIAALQKMFPRGNIITTNQKRALKAEKSYLQFIGSKTTVIQQTPEYIRNWMAAPWTTRGENPPIWISLPKFSIDSSRYKNDYTQCIIMRSKHSVDSPRSWHPSRIAERNIWKFDGTDDSYPEKWETKLLKNAKYTDDQKKHEKAPEKINFYTRFKKYEEWSRRGD